MGLAIERRGMPCAGLLLLALGACAHLRTVPADIRALVEADLSSWPLCVRLPQDEHSSLRANGVTLVGYRHADGRISYQDSNITGEERIRRTYDLLVEFGLFTVVEEQPWPAPSPLVRRRYLPTPAGQAHYRTRSPSHGAPDWQALCVGHRTMIAFGSPGEVRRITPCEEARAATYTYRFENLPAWIDDPRLRALLPELGTRSDAARPREGSTLLVRRGVHWYPTRGDPLVQVVCITD